MDRYVSPPEVTFGLVEMRAADYYVLLFVVGAALALQLWACLRRCGPPLASTMDESKFTVVTWNVLAKSYSKFLGLSLFEPTHDSMTHNPTTGLCPSCPHPNKLRESPEADGKTATRKSGSVEH